MRIQGLERIDCLTVIRQRIAQAAAPRHAVGHAAGVDQNVARHLGLTRIDHRFGIGLFGLRTLTLAVVGDREGREHARGIKVRRTEAFFCHRQRAQVHRFGFGEAPAPSQQHGQIVQGRCCRWMVLAQGFFLNRERTAIQRFGLRRLVENARASSAPRRRPIQIILFGLLKEGIGDIVQTHSGIGVFCTQHFFARNQYAPKYCLRFLKFALQHHHAAQIGQCRQRGRVIRSQLPFMHRQRLPVQCFSLTKIALRRRHLRLTGELLRLRRPRRSLASGAWRGLARRSRRARRRLTRQRQLPTLALTVQHPRQIG